MTKLSKHACEALTGRTIKEVRGTALILDNDKVVFINDQDVADLNDQYDPYSLPKDPNVEYYEGQDLMEWNPEEIADEQEEDEFYDEEFPLN